MNTLFFLMAQYDARAIVPAEIVCRNYFSHLTLAKFLRKIGSGDIDLPPTRSEKAKKAPRTSAFKTLRNIWTGTAQWPCQKPLPFRKEPEVEANDDLGNLTNCRINANDVQIF